MWVAWRQTLTRALFEPERLFSAVRLDRPRAHVEFAVLTASVFWIAGDVLERLVLAAQREQMRRLLEPLRSGGRAPPWAWSLLDRAQGSTGGFVLSLAFVPLLVLAGLYLNAAATHAVALLFGQARRGFAATLAACAYAVAPFVLFAVPGCGWIVALLWTAVLTSIGLKHTHGIGTAGATAVALAPYVLLCCAGCAMGGAVFFAMSRGLAP
jgi:hypothetical protein